jgi:adhesin transport system outer membrane protein
MAGRNTRGPGYRHTRSPLVVLALAGAMSAATVSAATLRDAVQAAVASSPDVLELSHARLARLQELEQARGGYLPSLDVNAGYGFEYTDNPSTRARGLGAGERLWRQEAGITASQMVFDGYATESEVARQAARVESSGYRLHSTAQSTAVSAAQAYLEVLRYREEARLAEENLQVHRRILDQIRMRSDAGVGRRADLDQIRAREALAQSNVIAAQANLRDAITTYKRVIGDEPGPDLSMPALDGVQLPESLDAALQLALQQHPALSVAEADVVAASAQREAARSSLYPRLDLELAGNHNVEADGIPGQANDYSVMLRLRYNLFRGGSDEARLRQTVHQIDEAKQIRDRARRQVEETLRLAWTAYEATSRQLTLVTEQVKFGEATRDAYAKQFNIGQRTLLDLLNTENELFQARQTLAGTRTDLLTAKYRVLEAMGSLLQSMDVALDEGHSATSSAAEG